MGSEPKHANWLLGIQDGKYLSSKLRTRVSHVIRSMNCGSVGRQGQQVRVGNSLPLVEQMKQNEGSWKAVCFTFNIKPAQTSGCSSPPFGMRFSAAGWLEANKHKAKLSNASNACRGNTQYWTQRSNSRLFMRDGGGKNWTQTSLLLLTTADTSRDLPF